MTISEAGAAGSATPFAATDPALSPEGLVAILSRQLEGFDEQLAELVGDLQQVNRDTAALGQKKEVLEGVLTRMGDDGRIHARDLTPTQRDVLRERGVELAPEKVYRELEQNGGPSGMGAGYRDAHRQTIDREAITSAIDGITTESTRASSGREIAMISLQQLVSQRANAIQLATNLLRKFDEPLDVLARNIGR